MSETPSDVVTRLRLACEHSPWHGVLKEAAERIEQLEAELAACKQSAAEVAELHNPALLREMDAAVKIVQLEAQLAALLMRKR